MTDTLKANPVATQERDEAIAAGMGKLLRQARRKARTAPGERARSRHRARNGHAAGNALPEDQLETSDHALDLGRNRESGRRESNPHGQLGRCTAHGCHGRWPAGSGIRW